MNPETKIKLCKECNAAMIKKRTGHIVYHECSYCGKKEEK